MAKLVAIDTNVLLRYFLQDNSDLGKKAENIIFQAQEEKINLWISKMVIAELVWVLKSFYKLTRPIIIKKIKTVAATPGVILADKQATIEALMIFFETNVDLDDIFIAVEAKNAGIKYYASFDKDFGKFSWWAKWGKM